MAKPHPALLALARAEQVPPISDPDTFFESAVDHRMVGLVWTGVTKGEMELPSRITNRLAAEDLAVTARHQRLWTALEEASSRLLEAGIESATFKGVTDEKRWFQRVGERPSNDVDLVISDRGRFGEAVSILEPDHPLAGMANSLDHKGFAKAIDVRLGGVFVDLHTDPIKAGPGWEHPELWWESTETTITPGGVTVRVFNREASAVLRLLHLGKDRFRTLLGVLEAHRMLETDFNWHTALRLSQAEGITAPVVVAAEIVHEVLGDTLELNLPRNWRVALWRRMWRPDVRLNGDSGYRLYPRRSQWGIPLMMPGRTIETLRWMLRGLVPPREIHEFRHPDMSGPYVWQLTGGRLKFYRARLREAHRSYPSE